MINKTIGLGLLSAMLYACGSNGDTSSTTGAISAGRVSGDVADEMGTPASGLGGSGTVSATTHVQIVSLEDGGSTHILASGNVSGGNGAYAIDVPRHDGILLAQALDTNENVLASAILEQQTSAESTVDVQPIDTESSVEANVLVDMLARGGATLETVDLVDLRARIDAGTAAAVRESAAATASTLAVNAHALAGAMLSAEASESLALMAHAVDLTQYRTGEMSAVVMLNGQLATGADSSAMTQANAQFMSGLDQLDTQLGMTAQTTAATETRISAEVRLAVQNMTTDGSVIAANARAAAVREGHFVINAMTAVATQANVSADAMTSLQTANATLQSALDASVDASSASAAYDAWRASLRNWFMAPNGLLSTVNATLGAIVEGGAIDALYALGAGLDASITTDVQASLMGTATLDASGFASRVDSTFTSFTTNVQSQVQSSLTGLGVTDAANFTSAAVIAAGSDR